MSKTATSNKNNNNQHQQHTPAKNQHHHHHSAFADAFLGAAAAAATAVANTQQQMAAPAQQQHFSGAHQAASPLKFVPSSPSPAASCGCGRCCSCCPNACECQSSCGSHHEHESSSLSQTTNSFHNGGCNNSDDGATSSNVDDHDAADVSANYNYGEFVPVFPSVTHILPHANPTARGQVPWRCSACGTHAFGHKCGTCARSRDMAALRVFVGQLSREGAQPMVSAMIDALVEEGTLSAPPLHIEAHTNASNGLGKGCCWVYVHSIDDIMALVAALNKRTYVCISEQSGAVGFRVFPATMSNEEIRGRFYEEHESLTYEAQALLHPSPVTAEVPKSMITRVHQHKEKKMQRAQFQQQQQQQQQQRKPLRMEDMPMTAFVPAPPQMPRVVATAAAPSANMNNVNSDLAPSTASPAAFLGPSSPSHEFAYGSIATTTVATAATSSTKQAKRYHWNPYKGTRVPIYAH